MGNSAYLMHFLFFIGRGKFARWNLLAELLCFLGVSTGEFWRAMAVLNLKFEAASREEEVIVFCRPT